MEKMYLYKDLFSNQEYIFKRNQVKNVFLSEREIVGFYLTKAQKSELEKHMKILDDDITVGEILGYLERNDIPYETPTIYICKLEERETDNYIMDEEALEEFKSNCNYFYEEYSEIISKTSELKIEGSLAYMYRKECEDRVVLLNEYIETELSEEDFKPSNKYRHMIKEQKLFKIKNKGVYISAVKVLNGLAYAVTDYYVSEEEEIKIN